jgi:hypothetical protein
MCNLYLLTSRNTLMPCSTDGIVVDGLVEVTSPNGTAYTCRPDALVSTEDGASMLRQRRAEQLVAEGYQIRRLRGDRYHVWQPAKHGELGNLGGYVVTMTEGCEPVCSCPDAMKNLASGCKHALGAEMLLKFAQVTKPTVAPAPATITRTKPRLTLAEMIARDGWA